MERKRSLAKKQKVDSSTASTEQKTTQNTRDALLDAALERFSRTGFGGTSIRDLATAVGIRESSVYKHFTSKQAIFDALIERADERLVAATVQYGAVASDTEAAAEAYRGTGEEELCKIAHARFDFVTGDPQFTQLRRLMNIEQYRDAGVAERFREYLIGRPLAFQTEIFRKLIKTGQFRDGLDPEQIALAFFGPIYLLMQYADGNEDEQRIRELLTRHIRHFRVTHLKEA